MSQTKGSLLSIYIKASLIGDKDTKETEDGEEKVFKSVYLSAEAVQENPLFLARSMPFNYLSQVDNSGSTSFAFFDCLLSSSLLHDSAIDRSLVDSKPECMQFIEFYLPGVVDCDPWVKEITCSIQLKKNTIALTNSNILSMIFLIF